jgi:hypothetical protein
MCLIRIRCGKSDLAFQTFGLLAETAFYGYPLCNPMEDLCYRAWNGFGFVDAKQIITKGLLLRVSACLLCDFFVLVTCWGIMCSNIQVHMFQSKRYCTRGFDYFNNYARVFLILDKSTHSLTVQLYS